MRNKKTVFTGIYQKYRTGQMVITRHLVKGYCYANGKTNHVKLYYDCSLYSLHSSMYHGHNYKGLDGAGQGPDVIYTRKDFHKTLTLNKYGGNK